MFPLARRCARLVRLLTVLWAVGWCGASQSDSQPSANVGIAPEHLLRLLVQEVRESEIQPLDSRLTSRFDGLDSRLIGIEARLNALDFKQDRCDFKQDRFDSRLDELVSRVDSTENRFDSRLDELVSRADSTEARFDSRLDELVSRVDSTEDRFESRLDELVSRVDSTENRFGSRLNELVSRVNSTEDRLDSRLDELVSRADSTEARLNSRLDELVSRVDSTEARFDSRLDEFASRVDSTEDRFESRLDELVSRVDSTENRFGSRLDELVSRVNSTEDRLDSRLNELVSRADSTEARFDSRLDELVSQADSTEDRVDSRLDKLISRVNSTEDRFNSRLDKLVSRVNSTEDRLDYRPAIVPRDCSELPAGAQTGVHLLQPGLDRSQPPVSAYCDLDTDGGGWTVIQRRADIKPRQDFFLDWAAYREGFGELDKEFWWGLDNMWTMTAPKDRRYELRVNLADFDGGRRHAIYQQFRVASEADGYRLFFTDYTGDAGDSLRYHSGQKFSTRDRDQDGSNSRHCAQEWKGAWWYKTCYTANLNGQYRSGPHAHRDGGVNWNSWKNDYSLKDVEMKIRPVNTI